MVKNENQDREEEHVPTSSAPTPPTGDDIFSSFMADQSLVLSFRLNGRQLRTLANGAEIIVPYKGTKMKIKLVDFDGLRCRNCGTRIQPEEAESGEGNCPECWSILHGGNGAQPPVKE